jgi:hypothetical protein
MEKIKTLKVTFDNPTSYGRSGKEYSFKTLLEVKVGEKVVVECATGFQVCTVTSVRDGSSPNATAWAFQRVDQGHLAFLKGREESMRGMSNRAREIRKDLEARLKAREAADRYAQLTRDDKVARDLYVELQSLEGALGGSWD